MANEKDHLLSFESEENHASAYRNKMSTSSDVDHDLKAAVNLIKEQSEMLVELRGHLSKEEEKNEMLSNKIDLLFGEFEKVNKNYAGEIAQQNEEIEKIKMSLEAQTEFQASIADELRFQIQSLRNKIDLNKNLTITNGDVSLPLKQASPSKSLKLAHADVDESPKTIRRKNSADSTSSSTSIPCLVSRPTQVHRGEITWRINAFTKKLKRIRSGNHDDPARSEPFTTGLFGYRLIGWAYLNGRGKGHDRCLSIYIRVMAGEYDPILQWPIKPCYTFYIISQHEDVNKRLDMVRVRDLAIKHSGIYRPTKEDKTIIVGFDDFIVHEDIEKKNYLLDDSLFIKLVVEVPSL